MVSLTELVIKHHDKIQGGEPSRFYEDISNNCSTMDLNPNDFIETQRMLLVLRSQDITDINVGIAVAYLEKQRDAEGAYEKIKEVLRQVADSPYLPEEARMSINVLK